MNTLLVNLIADDPAPAINVTPSQPPGSAKMLEVLNWVSWSVSFCGVLALIFFGIYLMLVRRRGMSVDSVGYFWQIIIGGGVAALAPLIVTSLVKWGG
jgi:hypothetical protein